MTASNGQRTTRRHSARGLRLVVAVALGMGGVRWALDGSWPLAVATWLVAIGFGVEGFLPGDVVPARSRGLAYRAALVVAVGLLAIGTLAGPTVLAWLGVVVLAVPLSVDLWPARRGVEYPSESS